MLISIYDFKDQNQAILALLRSRKTNFRTASTACQIHPSYFSRALKGEAPFSQQQIFRLAEFLELNDRQKDYLLLLWNFRESQGRDEKSFFLNKIQKIQEENQKVSNRIKAKIVSAEERRIQLELYYGEALTALIHMHLTISKFRSQPALLEQHLGISTKKLNAELEKIEGLGLIIRSSGKITQVEDSIHLPEESSLSFVNHINWRIKAIQEIERREPKDGDYHLSVVFSASEETKLKLKQVLRSAVIEAKNLVGECSTPTQVFHLMMDLF